MRRCQPKPGQRSRKKKSAVIGECDAGLLKVAVPIFVRDVFLGIVGGCGQMMDNCQVESFLLHKITGLDEEKIERLSGDIPSMNDVALEELVEDHGE